MEQRRRRNWRTEDSKRNAGARLRNGGAKAVRSAFAPDNRRLPVRAQ
jgi:hypothetical protein